MGQWSEINLGYIHSDVDLGGSDNAYTLDGKLYFERVSTANRPLSEAAFLGRNGAVNLGYGYQNHADTNSVELGVNTKYFFTPTMNAQFGYTYNAEHVEKDTAINLGLSTRF